ncbi:MAG: hypothetical protein NTU79_15650 [Planctomycetota bacterium]|nr:hypothetical protein [Planctomycetota bacterium]
MNELFLAFAAAFIVPLLFQSWRIAIAGLAVQGILLSILPAAHVHEWTPQVVFECITLIVFRGILTPWLIVTRLSPDLRAERLSLIGTNLFQWACAAILITSGYLLANAISPNNAQESIQFGTAVGCILIGMLILSNRSNRLGQAVGLLTIESGMALVELLSPHAMPFPASIGVAAVYLFLILTILTYLQKRPDKMAVMNPAGNGRNV